MKGKEEKGLIRRKQRFIRAGLYIDRESRCEMLILQYRWPGPAARAVSAKWNAARLSYEYLFQRHPTSAGRIRMPSNDLVDAAV